ncbi:MAG: serine/threonine-protein kinase [Sandaracinaceae bacterium]
MEPHARRLGRYQLLSRLGSGGMGDVYRARTFGAEGVQKDLCLKLIREPRLRQPDALARFIREARLWVKLQHGTIVAVFDFGRSGSDYYLAMEWVDGADAGSLVGSAPLPGHVAAHVAAEVARALDYAHGEGVVHCDVKPANVLISRAGDVKLADFGLARAIGTEAGGGTPGYAAPEQRAGDEVDARADLFSLGVLLTALATGGRDPSELEGRLAEHVAHLTQTDRNARPPDAATVANALEGFVAEKRAGGALSPREVLSQRARDADPEEREARAQLADARSLLALDEDSMRSTVSAPSVPEPVPSPSRWKRVLPLVALLFAGLGAWGLSTTPRGGTDAAPPSASGVADAPPLAPAPAAVMNEPSPTSASEAPEPEAASGNATAVHAREAPRRATRRAPAHVSINAIPWARVRIDGRDAGITPLLDVALPAGRHVVSLENDALGVRDVRVLRLSPGASERLVVTLAP